jgi:hypothetical protein
MPLNLKALQDEVLNHGFDGTYRSRITVWLNEAQHRIARSSILPELTEATTVTTTVGVNSVPLPSGLVRVRAVVNVTNGRNLESTSLLHMDGYDTSRSGSPLAFTIDEATSSLLLYPVPDSAYDLKIRYLGVPTEMVDDTDVPSTPSAYQDLLVTYALGKAYRSEDDFEASLFYQNQFASDLAKMQTDEQYRDTTPRKVPGTWDY